MNILEHLKNKSRFLNINAIEHELKLATGTLSRAINDKRKLTTEQEENLNKFFACWAVCDDIKEDKQQIKPKQEIKKQPKINKNDFQLLLSGKYRNNKTRDILTREELSKILDIV